MALFTHHPTGYLNVPAGRRFAAYGVKNPNDFVVSGQLVPQGGGTAVDGMMSLQTAATWILHFQIPTGTPAGTKYDLKIPTGNGVVCVVNVT